MAKVRGRSLAAATGGRRRRRVRSRKGNPAAASSGASDRDLKRNQAASASLGGEILRRKKELMAATEENDVLLARKLTEEEARRIVAREMKRKKVVKRRVPQGLIDCIMVMPKPIVRDIPDDELAKCSEHFREAHAREKAMSDLTGAYHQAILDQYYAQGYAEDEMEVTDDEEEIVED